MAWTGLRLEGLSTKLPPRCWPGWWSQLRTDWGRVQAQAHMVVRRIQFVANRKTEDFTFLLAVR